MSNSLPLLRTQPFYPSLHPRSLVSVRANCPQCVRQKLPSTYHSTRQFTTTRRRNAGAVSMVQKTNVDSLLPKRASMKSQVNKSGTKHVGSDVGMMPQTIVLPPTKELPRWTSFKRYKLHWLQLKTAFKDFWSLVLITKWDVPRDPLTNKRMTKSMELNERLKTARQLHYIFHRALATGQTKALQEICCTGLLEVAKKRIARRLSMNRSKEEWTLVKYSGIKYPTWLLKWPFSVILPRASLRVVSDKYGPLPMPNSSLRQCVVRIKSLQRYRLANSDPDPNSRPTVKLHTDHVVMQKMTLSGEEGRWMIWGLTEPTSMEELDKILEGKVGEAKMTLAERVQDNFGRMSSF